MYVEVILRTLSRTIDQVYTYQVPDIMGIPCVGDRVVVPFGGGDRYIEGVIWRLLEAVPSFDTKSVAALLDERHRMSRSQMILMQGIRRYYGATYSQSFNCVLPSIQQLVVEPYYKLTDSSLGPTENLYSEAMLLERFTKAQIQKFIRAGTYVKMPQFTFKVPSRVDEIISIVEKPLDTLLEQVPKRALVAKRLLEHLHGVKSCHMKALTQATNASRKAVMALVEKGLFAYQVVSAESDPLAYSLETSKAVGTESTLEPLTDQQVAVVDGFSGAALLDGVTGSGKTRVYLELARSTLERGQQVLLLVPEISLTPQLVSRFSALKVPLAVLHSRVQAKDRLDFYRRIQVGEIKIVIGARSGIFAPFKDLGLIVVDEEHEQSYRSDTVPQYDARDLVSLLHQALNIPVLFGSASPSAQRLALVDRGRLQHLKLSQRVGLANLPSVQVVDLRMTKQVAPLLTGPLCEALEATLARGEQAIILHNRKGFARYTQCTSCGHVEKCVNCDIPLTVYQQGTRHLCHYCGYKRAVQNLCPACGGQVDTKGYGLEQVEDALRDKFPNVVIQGVDSDSAAKQDQFIAILQRFSAGEIQVLVGTQLIAKGLDFPNVTFVGVLLADQMLNLPDFGAGERAMQMLLQVAGRAGRASAPGTVMIQTYQPDHDVIRHVQTHHYQAYIQQEMALRKVLNYPPYGYLYTVRVVGDSQEGVQRQSEIIFKFYHDNFGKQEIPAQIFPPKPAYYGKIKNKYVYQLVIKSEEALHSRMVKLLYLGLVKNQYQLIENNFHVDFSINPTF